MTNKYTGLEIAVIGMAGQFPGAGDVNRFWHNLKNAVESITSLNEEDILAETGDKSLLSDPSYVKANSFMADKEFFDAGFFGYRPEEAAIMDPQIRIFHENCWKAMEDAGYDITRAKDKVGLFAGATGNFNWEAFSIMANRENNVDPFTASQLRNVNYLCSKVAYKMNLQGPVMFVNTACSTSLVAIQRALLSLLLRECDMALAGGITINNHTREGYLYQEGMILSKDGHCRAFDRAASGTVGGEGVGVVVLKRLEDAMKDNDHIYAVIKGGAINNDGHHKVSFTAPSPNGQYLAILKALNMARVEPGSISYIEAHGTGTPLGDPIEVEALNKVFGKSKHKYCALGSVKTNVGHLDSAAGVAGFIKTALSLYHRQIPASLHYQEANPQIDFSDSPLYVNTALQEWKNDKYPLRAGVSSFGIGGTNAHVILEEAPERTTSSGSRAHQLLLFSAKTNTSLENYIKEFGQYLSANDKVKLADIAYTLHTARGRFPYRKAIVCSTTADAQLKIAAPGDVQAIKPLMAKVKKKIVFLFPGQGAQYQGMCYGLYKQEEVFRAELDNCFSIASRISGVDLKEILFPTGPSSANRIDHTEYTQPLLFIVEYALARLLQKWGIQPDIMIGHSIGEYVAACMSGVFTLEDALRLVIKRGALMQQAPRGIMLSVSIKEAALLPYLANHPAISLAAINSTEQCVISGEDLAVHAIKEELDTAGYSSKIIRTSHAFHSHLMDGLLQTFEQEVSKVAVQAAQIPFISNLTGSSITDEELSNPAYWSRHLRETVQFSKGITALLSSGNTIFIEVGPGRSLSSFVRSHHLRTPEHTVINLVKHVQEGSVDDQEQLLKGVGALWMEGVELSWDNYYEKEQRNRVPIPTYRFDKVKFPVNVNAEKMIAGMIADRSVQKHKNISEWLYVPTWKLAPLMEEPAPEPGNCALLFCDAGATGEKLQSQLSLDGHQVIKITPGNTFREITPHWYEIHPSDSSGYAALVASLSHRGYEINNILHAWSLLPQQQNGHAGYTKDLIFYSLVHLVQALSAAGKLSTKKLTLLTHSLHPVLDKVQQDILPALSAGLLKVISQENPTVITNHIDISREDMDTEAWLASLSSELCSQKSGRSISYRHAQRWERMYERVPARKEIKSAAFKKGGLYIITGGLGMIGSNLSEYLLKEFEATVILLGRTKLPDPSQWTDCLESETIEQSVRNRIVQLQALSQLGGHVVYKDCNIGNSEALSRVMNDIETRFGRVNGIIHAAGEVPGSSLRTITELSPTEFEQYFDAKISGLQALKQATHNKEPDFVIVTSSLSSILGGIGFGGYAPANNFVDYYVSSQQMAGECSRWISINLDAVDLKVDHSTEAIAKSEFIELINRMLNLLTLGQVVVSVKDLNDRLEKWVYRDRMEEAGSSLQIHHWMQSSTAETGQAGSFTATGENGLTTVEQKLLILWRQFFGRDNIGVRDDFFEIGGDSLKALTIISRIHKIFNVEIPVREFFNRPTIKMLGDFIQEQANNVDGANTPAAYKSITPAVEKPYYQLSAAQSRLYFMHELEKTSLAYNLPQVINLKGVLHKELMLEAFNKLIQHHDSLRTSIVSIDGETVQQIAPTGAIEIKHVKLGRGESAGDAIRSLIRPFVLQEAPLIRVGLIEQGTDDHILVVDMPHIITDGVSYRILIEDFVKLYKGESIVPSVLQYKDYAEWQQSPGEKERIAKQQAFWLKEFADEVIPLELPMDHPRPFMRSNEGDYYNFSLDKKQTSLLNRIVQAEKASMFMVLLSVYYVLLARLSNLEDIVIGTSTAGRRHPDLENIMGMFVNTLPLRNFPKGELTFKEFLAAVKQQTLSGFEHQEYQYEDMIEALQITRDTSRNPLFDVMFVLQNFEKTVFELPGLTALPYNNEHKIAKFDLTLTVTETDDQLFLSLEYCTALFKRERIVQFAGYLEQIVNIITANIDCKLADIELLRESEKSRLLQLFDYAAVNYPKDKTVTRLFEEQVARTPENIAVQLDKDTLTYRQLNDKANKLAFLLQEKGVKPETIVGLVSDRSIEMLIGMLGIIKAGGAYLPIDVDYPKERQEYILQNSGARIVFVPGEWQNNTAYNGLIITMEDVENLPNQPYAISADNKPTDLCYIIYTSGTTGNPKGVMIEHRNLVRLLFSDEFQFDFNANDVWTMFHSHCFDFSVWEIYGALLYGGKVIIIPKTVARDTKAYLDILQKEQVTVLNQTPTAFYNLIQEELADTEHALSLRYVIFAGEALSPAKLALWRQKYQAVKLINMYGITETTVHVTYKEIGEYEIENNISNIGKPIPTLSLYILDKYGKLIPEGCIGELYVGGDGVGRGYVRNEELTQRRFIPNPYNPAERLYRSGDLARILASGDIEYLGRIDEQLKIRGFRIEPAEIAHQLTQYESIKESVVVAREKDGNKFLVAYYVSEVLLESITLRNFLLQRLPDYMVPSFFVQLEQLPLTSNGKLDRKSLPHPEVTSTEHYIAPVNDQQKLLAAIWQKVLGIDRVGISDNFFSIGGDSIKSIQIIARLRMEGFELTVKDIFGCQTIEALAPRLKRNETIADQSSITGKLALTPIQRWFFDTQKGSPHHFNQSVMLKFEQGISATVVRTIFRKLQEHHDALRMVFRQPAGIEMAEILATSQLDISITEKDLSGEEAPIETLASYANQLQQSIDLQNGPLMRLGLFHLQDGSRLLVVIHHLAVDGISWRILFEDIETLYTQVQQKRTLALPLKTDSYQYWSQQLPTYMNSASYREGLQYWLAMDKIKTDELPSDTGKPPGRLKDRWSAYVELTREQTAILLKDVHGSFGTQINDLLITALLMSVERMYTLSGISIDMEGHGREDISSAVNVSRTVGWFTSIYPLLLEAGAPGELLPAKIKRVKESIRRIPNKGIDYLMGVYLEEIKQINRKPSQIAYNYLGQFDADTDNRQFTIANEFGGHTISEESYPAYAWELAGMVAGGILQMKLFYSREQYHDHTITAFMNLYKGSLLEIMECCQNHGKRELTPDDLTYKQLTITELEKLEAGYPQLEDVYPLSPMQEGLLFQSLLDKTSPAYFEQITYRWEGDLNIGFVRKSMRQLIQRYDVLRTVFIPEGYERPLQVVLKTMELECHYIDARENCIEENKALVVKQYQQQDRSQGFNFQEGPLMRLTILRTGGSEYEFIWSHHHILMDGWCMGLVIQDFRELYRSETREKPAMLSPVQRYATYISWMEKQDRQASGEYWQSYLEGYDSIPVFPEKETVTDATGTGLSATHRFVLDELQTEKLKAVCAQYGVTQNMIVQTVWGILVSKYNNNQDAVFGAVVSGRPAAITGIERMVGLFINTIPVRIKYGPTDTVASLVQRIKEEAMQGEPYHYHSLAAIQELSAMGNSLINHIMVFENYPVAEEIADPSGNATDGYSVTNVESFEQTNYDLSLMVIPGRELQMRIDYNTARYEQVAIAGIALHMIHILHQVLDNMMLKVVDVQLATEKEHNKLLTVFNDTAVLYPTGKSVIELFEEQAAQSPDSIAVCYNETRVSYAALNEMANVIAWQLIDKAQLEPNDKIALLIGPSIEMVATMLAILKAGCTYVALSPDVPAERNKFIYADCRARALVVQESLLTRNAEYGTIAEEKETIIIGGTIKAPRKTRVFKRPSLAESLIYTIYTSGTTGTPKGVEVRTTGILNMICFYKQLFHLKAGMKLSQVANIGFDAAAFEIWPCLTAGGELHIAPSSIRMDAELMGAWLVRESIDITFQPPVMAELLLKQAIITEGHSLQVMNVAGDVLNYYPVDPLPFRLFNLYGPTEDSIWTTYLELTPGKPARQYSIGKPIANKKIFIVDSHHHLLPIGVPGELCIAGTGLANGYLNNEVLTKEKFVTNPFGTHEKMYKTGDLAKWTQDGEILFLGRTDNQVKIRGFRIEIGEIEARINAFESVDQSAVVVVEKNNDKYLVAYYTPAHAVNVQQLREYLTGHLPHYMVPAFFVPLAKLPYSFSGKLDRKALPEPVFERSIQLIAPANEVQKKLVAIWAGVLDIEPEKIGITDNFFDIGGNSLKLMNMVNKINTQFDARLSVAAIFKLPVITAIARYIVEKDTAPAKEEDTSHEDGLELMKQSLGAIGRI